MNQALTTDRVKHMERLDEAIADDGLAPGSVLCVHRIVRDAVGPVYRGCAVVADVRCTVDWEIHSWRHNTPLARATWSAVGGAA